MTGTNSLGGISSPSRLSIHPPQAYIHLPGFADIIRYRGQNLALSWTHTFSPNILNELRFGFSRNMDVDNCEHCPRAAGFVQSFGITGLTALSPKLEGFPASSSPGLFHRG